MKLTENGFTGRNPDTSPGWVKQMNQLAKKKVPFLFILDYELKNPVIKPLHEIDNEEILFSFNNISNIKDPDPNHIAVNINAEPPSYDFFLDKFTRVQNEIHAGNTYLLNLCFQTPVAINHTLRDIFHLSRAPYKLWMKNNFMLYSPETFVKIRDGKISTFPMKGTLEKTSMESVNQLLNDKKEAAEHATITDLLRNDLGRVADHVQVKKYRYINEIRTTEKTILQVSSEIEGKLKAEYIQNPGNIFRELLPAGSVTGAPKEKTLQIIKETENFERGYYTGVFGVHDGKTLDSAVMIRFIEERNGEYFYKSGGGITYMSDPVKEYNEIIQKIYVPVY